MRSRWSWVLIGLLLGTAAMASAGASYLAPRPSPTPLPPTVDTTGRPEYWLVGGEFNCSTLECLFASELEPNYPVGVATLTGHYVQVSRADMGGDVKMCDCLVVSGGSPEYIRSVNALIDAGNGMNSRTDAGDIIINLDLGLLDDAERQRITDSTPGDPVTLLVLSPPAPGRGAYACEAHVQILKVE